MPPGWRLWVDGPADGTTSGVPAPPRSTAGLPAAALPVQPGEPRPPRPWFKKKRFILPAALLLLIIIIGALGGGADDSDRTPDAGGATRTSAQADEETPEEIAAEAEAERLAEAEAAAEAEAEAAAKAEEERLAQEARLAEEAAAAEAAAAEAARIGTLSQQNAYSQAKSYLALMPFSRAGLMGQLTSEYGGQFPAVDAEFAVARLEAEGGVDWNAEAVEAAQAYQELMPMSRQGLIDQLTSEYGSQFTLEQATYAVNTLGL